MLAAFRLGSSLDHGASEGVSVTHERGGGTSGRATARQRADAARPRSGSRRLPMDRRSHRERRRRTPGRYLPSIADVTHASREWFASRRRTGQRRARAAPLPHLGVVGRHLVLGSIVLLVTIRFFTEVVPVLPRAANFIDIPIFLALVFAAMSMTSGQTRPRVPARSASRRLHSSCLRSHPRPSMPTAPRPHPCSCSSTDSWRRSPSTRRSTGSGRRAMAALSLAVLVGLGLLQLVVVALIDLRRFVASGGNADVISGTFGTNAYQMVFFLLVVASLLVGIFTLEPGRPIARFVPVIIPAIFVVILLAQYRALLATTVVTMVVVGVLLGRHARGLLAAVLAVVAFAFVVLLRRVEVAGPQARNDRDDADRRARGRTPAERLRQLVPSPTSIATSRRPARSEPGPGRSRVAHGRRSR